MTQRIGKDEEQVLRRAMLRINEQGWGIAIGMVLGLGLFIATNVLIIRGGESVGQHLSLLGVYFPGYRVTVVGSLIGFVYAFVLGYGIGRTIAVVYNRLAHRAR
jgi:hypothetical protein